MQSATALVKGDFSPDRHFYPLLYPLMGAVFVPWCGAHCFFLVDLAALLWFTFVFFQLCGRHVANATAVCLLLYALMGDRAVFEQFVIPWTTTAGMAFLSWGLLELDKLHHRTAAGLPGLWGSFRCGLAVGLVQATRPLDGVAALPLLAFYGWELRRRVGKRSLVRHGLSQLVGFTIPVVANLAFNRHLFGEVQGGYIHVAASAGFSPQNLWQKFVAIFCEGYDLYLEPAASLIDRLPWLVLALVGLPYAMLCLRGSLRAAATIIVLQFIVFLPYGGLLPNGLWQYRLVHYFKWTFPYLALFAWLWVLWIFRQWRGNRWRCAAAVAATLVSCGLLLSLKLEVRSVPATTFVCSIEGSQGQVRADCTVDTASMDLVDVVGATGVPREVFSATKHHAWLDGRQLRFDEFRVLCAPWGIRVLLTRPLSGRHLEMLLDPSVHLGPTIPRAEVGFYHTGLAWPNLFSRGEAQSSNQRASYRLGQEIDFTTAGAPQLYLRRGWFESESGGTWTSGSSGAELSLPLATAIKTDLLLDVKAVTWVCPQKPAQVADMEVGGQWIGRGVFKGGGLEEIRLRIPRETVVEGCVNLTFKVVDPRSPSDLGLGPDHRLLGICIRSMRVDIDGR